MKLSKLAASLGWRALVEGNGEEAVTGGYCGDLLSWVMGKAAPGEVWITVMGNINAVAVAVLTGAACILLAENASLDEDARARAGREGVAVYQSGQSAYALAAAVSSALKQENQA